MRYLYTIHGRNIQPHWGITKRKQGRHTRLCVDCGYRWVAVYWRAGS